ncbi:MAG: flagellar basal-body MS-ring/collar protein FliF [Rhodospirillales bacterium]
MNGFIESLRNLGTVRLAAMGAVAAAMIGFLIYAGTQFSTQSMSLLYSDLDPRDAGAIGQRLDAAQIPYTVNPDGRRIMVPEPEVGRARMLLAQAGLPSGGNVGNEIFNQPEGFGTTTFMQNVNQLRAMEGELARTIQTLQPVQQARVHLVLPRRELFSRERQTATASVFLRLRPGQQLNREQVGAIQHLVATGVPQLDPGRISIIDEKGNLLARGTGSDSQEALMSSAQERRRALEQRMVRTIEDLLGRSLGYGKVRAEVAVDLDFDRVATRSEVFDPDSTTPRSTQTVTEQNESVERDGLDSVTVQNQLPGNANDTGGVGTRNRQSRNEETVNFEISRTTRDHVREPGQVRRLSVAVLVDGAYPAGADGRPAYTPRSADEMRQIEALVRSSIGFDPVRGDSLEVVNMRFASAEDQFPAGEQPIFLGLTRDDLFSIAEMVLLAVVVVLVILLVVRPLIARLFEVQAVRAEETADQLLAEQGIPALTGPAGGIGQDLALEAQDAADELEQMIDINRVEGRVRASSVRKVGEIVAKHPEEAVAIIRNWMYQEL